MDFTDKKWKRVLYCYFMYVTGIELMIKSNRLHRPDIRTN